ncbi:MAG: DUF3108 domain-containing protein [Candidatus Zixiibacteriota bacterium]|nr:MAG: DUF3108 domain-containing protein [candidate division Zixibacteria bacterium]
MSRISRAMIIISISAAVALPYQKTCSRDREGIDSMEIQLPQQEPVSDQKSPHDYLKARKNDVLTEEYIEIASDSSWWYRKLDNRAFRVGERLEFSVKYGKLPAGSAVMEIPGIIELDGHDCYEIVSTAQSNNVVSVFYKVRDTVKTFVDIDGIFPHKFWKKLREGSYKTEKTTIFDQKNHYAVTDGDTIPTYTFVQDAFSSLYYIRTQELTAGQDIFIDNHTSKKNFPLKLKVLKKERVKVPAGEFDCVVVEPMMRAEGIFKAKGRIRVWLTDDQYKMPVLMKTEVFFLGSISAQLKEFERGRIEEEFE